MYRWPVAYVAFTVSLSPYQESSQPGFWIAAEPHSGLSRNPPLKTVYSGAMSGTMPLGSCESTVSRAILAQRRDMSKE